MRTDITKLFSPNSTLRMKVMEEFVSLQIKNLKGKGHDSKEFRVKRFIELDDLFFEGLGLWQGDGGKSKGLYFGNSCPEVINHFLTSVEKKLGIGRKMFRVTVNSPTEGEELVIKRRWSKLLGIPIKNFTHVCYDKQIKKEYAQVYINGIVLLRVMERLHQTFRPLILTKNEYAIPYLRGFLLLKEVLF